MSPRELLHAAERLLTDPPPGLEGLWARSAALLLRQALERAVAERLDARAPGARAANFRVQFLCLAQVGRDPEQSARLWCTWTSLSHACHHHGYELPPSGAELRSWLDVVREVAVDS